jgi:hypothetical protein
MTDRPSASTKPAEAAPGSLSVVASALTVRRANDAEIVIEGSRGAPAWPRFRTVWPVVLGVLGWGAALLAEVGDASWLALVVPTIVVIAEIRRRRSSVVTLFRGSRLARWQRGAVQLTVRWHKAELADDRLAVVLKLSGGEVRLPLRQEALMAARSQAAAFVEAFAEPEASAPATTGPVVDDAFFEEFGLIELSRARAVLLATEWLGLRLTLAVMAWIVGTGGALVLASAGRATPLVALALALAPACVWLVPVRRLTVEPGLGLGIDGDDPTPFDVELPQWRSPSRDATLPAHVDIRRGSRLLRLVRRVPPLHWWSEDILFIARRRVDGLSGCASFIQAFSQSPEEVQVDTEQVPPHSDASAAEQVLGWQESKPLVLTGKLRARRRPLERSGGILLMATMLAVPAIIGKSWLSGAIAIGAVFIGLVRWLISGLARPRLTFEPGARFLTWRLRGLEVRLRWTSIESARTGNGLIVRTEAGPLRVPLPRRTPERRIDAAIQTLERHFPPDEATAPPSTTWPAEFTAALDSIDFEAATPMRLRFVCGRAGPATLGLLAAVEGGFAFGILGIGPPTVVVLISLIPLIGWPFLFAVQDVAIERGTRSLIVHGRYGPLRERLTPAMLAVTTAGDTMTVEVFGLSILAPDHMLNVPLSTPNERTVEPVRRALLAFAGFDASEGET